MNKTILIHIIKKSSPNGKGAYIIIFVPLTCVVLLDVGWEDVVPSPRDTGLNYES